MKRAWAVPAVLCAAFLLRPAPVPAAGETPAPGVVVHLYGEPTFWYHGGTQTAPSADLDLDLNRHRWPPNNWDAAKGPVFHRGGGWSAAVRGAVSVEKAGPYRFIGEGVRAELRVNGVAVPLDGGGEVSLPAGRVPILLLLKAAAPLKEWRISFRLSWQGPGMAAPAPIPAGLFSHDGADAEATAAWIPDVLPSGMATPVYNRRSFALDIPEDGFYELAVQFSGIPRIFLLDLEGKPLFYVQGERAGGPEQRLDFRGRARAVRFLKKGPYAASVYGHYGPWIWDDEMDLVLANVKIGAARIPASDDRAALSIRAKDRETMVFRRGEPLTIAVEQATARPTSYRVEVKEQRGSDVPVWTQSVRLPGPAPRAAGEARYPCPKEGAYEYSVRDEAGGRVEGPWAFVVVDPAPVPDRPAAAERKILVDEVDCTLGNDAVHLFRDNGTSRVVESPAGRYRATGTGVRGNRGYRKDGETWREVRPGETAETTYTVLDWFAYTLRVKNPERPHMVVARVPNDIRRLVAVQGFDHVTGQYNGALLEAGDAPESGPFSPISFLMWPNGNAIDVTVFCSDGNHGSKLNRQGAAAKIELYEFPDGLPALSAPAAGWAAGREFGWAGEQVNLSVEQRMMPRLWEGPDMIPGSLHRFAWENGYHDWKALLTAWDRFGQYARWRGDNVLLCPVYTYGMSTLRAMSRLPKHWDPYSKGWRSRVVDPFERDQFAMMLLLAQKYGVRLVADFISHRIDAKHILTTYRAGPEAADGLFVTDLSGRPMTRPSGAAILNPAHPLARRWLVEFAEEMGRVYGPYPAFGGIRLRQWTWTSNLDAWFLSADCGYDDFTVGLFEKETGVKVPVADAGEGRFRLRRDFLTGRERDRWLDWRSRTTLSLREEMLAALRRGAPRARFYSETEPDREKGLDPALFAGRRDLGYGARRTFGGEGVEYNFLDPVEYRNFDVREPASLRRTLDSLASIHSHDYPSGMCSGHNSSIRSHPYQLEEPAKALADGKLDTALYGGMWIVPPMDDGIRRFARAYRAIPDLPYTLFPSPEGAAAPVICRYARRAGNLVFYLVNRTPRTRTVSLALAGGAGTADMVSGAAVSTGSAFTAVVEPFMARVFSARGATAVRAFSVEPDRERAAVLDREIAHLREIARTAAGTVRVIPGGGEPYVAVRVGQEQYDDGDWGRRDRKTTIGELLAPIEEARRKDETATVERLLDAFRTGHAWWYEVFGWPEGVYAYRAPAGPCAAPEKLRAALSGPAAATVEAVPPAPGKVVCAPAGALAFSLGAPASGRYVLTVWMLTGTGYGPLSVSVDGAPAGVLGTGTGPVRFVHASLRDPLPLAGGPHAVAFSAAAGRGPALAAVELAAVPPEPIRRWSAIGLFDKGSPTDDWTGMERVFPPEKTFDPAAVYPGLNGTEARWRRIDIGEDRFVQLLERFFPYDYTKGNGVAYLASWVFSPTARTATLFYAMDWYGKAWLDDAPVLPRISGPWRQWATVPVRLRQGWNRLLVKTSCGRSSWKANFALSDPGDLQYADHPPE